MRWHMTAAAALAALAALAGCDPTARPASSAPETPSSDRRSREHETCGRSADCAGDLRCFDGVCRRAKLSILGDLYSAVGDRALTAGRAGDAAEAYQTAIASYEKESIEPPPQLLCAHGGALVGDQGADRQKMERAARLLHRCLNGAPAGSFLRQRALAELAGLMDQGLDPAVLAKRDVADVYLSREPVAAAKAPAATELAVDIKMEGRSRSGSYRKFTEFIEKKTDLRAALTPCWKGHFDKTQKDTLTISVPFQYGSAWDEDETYLSSWIKLPEGKAPADAAAAEATSCARQALAALVEPEGKKLREETRWQAVATFTVAPGKP
jgi:hypothetical protein